MLKLIMFPYAGNLGYAYRGCLELLSQKAEVVMIDYDGRGSRYQAACPNTWAELANSAYEQAASVIKRAEDGYLLYGHSMGAFMAYDIYRKIIEGGGRTPKGIVFSGCKVFGNKVENRTKLQETEFREVFMRKGGIAPDVLCNEELVDYVFELLRYDIGLLEQFEYHTLENGIECPVVIMNGTDDTTSISTREEWEMLIHRDINYLQFEGDHFFIFKQKEKVFSQLFQIIDKILVSK